MKTRKIGAIYPDSKHYQTEGNLAAATVGAPGLTPEVFENRRKIRGMLTQEGKDALNLAHATVEKQTGVNTKIRWSRYAGCASCPCSPGYEIIQILAPEEDYLPRLKEKERIDIWLSEDGNLKIQYPKFGPFAAYKIGGAK